MATPQITLTAALQTLAGNSSTGCKLKITLINFGADTPSIAGFGTLSPITQTLPFTGPQISVPLWGNDVISPSGTRYLVQLIDNTNNVVAANEYELLGAGQLDLSAIPTYDATAGSATQGVIYTFFPANQNFKGAWSSSKTYLQSDAVSYTDGSSYVSLQPNNQNNDPSGSPLWWAVQAKAGTPTTFTGQWSSTAIYGVGQAVAYTDGSSYVSLQAANTNNVPSSSSTHWALMAAGGAAGLSAYQAAVAGGFVGTQSAWLASLYQASNNNVLSLNPTNELGLVSAFTDIYGFVISGLTPANEPYPNTRTLPAGVMNTATVLRLPGSQVYRDVERLSLDPTNEYGLLSAVVDMYGFILSGVTLANEPYPNNRILRPGTGNTSSILRLPTGQVLRDAERLDLDSTNELGLVSAVIDQYGFILSALTSTFAPWTGIQIAAVTPLPDLLAIENAPIVYQANDGNGTPQVFLIESGTTAQLTSSTGVSAAAPVMTPDRQKVVYTRGAAPYVMTRRGRNQVPVGTDVPGLFGVNQILTTGQSLSVGATAASVLTTTAFHRNVMFNGGVRPYGVYAQPVAGQTMTDKVTSFVPLVETLGTNDAETGDSTGFGETGWAAAANNLARLAMLGGRDMQFLMSAIGHTGTAISGLNAGSTSYVDAMSAISAARSIATAAGLSHGVIGVPMVHGEADEQANNTNYGTQLIAMQAAFEHDARAITGQATNIPFLLAQMSSGSTFYVIPGQTHRSFMAQMQADVARQNPGKFYLVGPGYQTTYNDIHHDPAGYQYMGELRGKIMAKVLLQQQEWTPLGPKVRTDGSPAIVRDGRFIYIDYDVPVGPLTFDTVSIVPDKYIPGSKFGFVYEDSTGTGTAAPAIASAAIVGNTVVLQLAAAPTGTSKRLSYALLGNPNNVCGKLTGARGNLRDSDPTVGMYGSQLWNWSVIFDYAIS